MREILFRAKRTDTDAWIEGNYLNDEEIAYISGFIYNNTIFGFEKIPFKCQVIPETVSEYIGLTDKNGRKIFEHDLLKDEFGFIHEVYFDDGCFMRKCGLRSSSLATTHCALVVVGNIFDNPELLNQ